MIFQFNVRNFKIQQRILKNLLSPFIRFLITNNLNVCVYYYVIISYGYIYICIQNIQYTIYLTLIQDYSPHFIFLLYYWFLDLFPIDAVTVALNWETGNGKLGLHAFPEYFLIFFYYRWWKSTNIIAFSVGGKI